MASERFNARFEKIKARQSSGIQGAEVAEAGERKREDIQKFFLDLREEQAEIEGLEDALDHWRNLICNQGVPTVIDKVRALSGINGALSVNGKGQISMSKLPLIREEFPNSELE